MGLSLKPGVGLELIFDQIHDASNREIQDDQPYFRLFPIHRRSLDYFLARELELVPNVVQYRESQVSTSRIKCLYVSRYRLDSEMQSFYRLR